MEKLKVAKVDSVLLQRNGKCKAGTVHLTQHHLIFVYDNIENGPSGSTSTSNSDADRKEIWFAYSLLWLVSRLPSITSLDSVGHVARAPVRRIYPLVLRLRNFESAAVGFSSEVSRSDVFESIRSCIIAPMPENLYAYYYQPRPPLPLAPQGWNIYDVKAEFARQGVGTRTKAWRFCDLNTGYGFCSTYPSEICIPSRISDTVVRHASKYRSKERIPALTYLHRFNLASITRSSQPLVGLNNRSLQDEKLIEAIFTSHLFADPNSATAQAALVESRNNTSTGNPATDRGTIMAIYGATTTNLIIDARPTTNAMANRAKGAGTENMEHYKGCKKVYLGVDNIHVMRDSLQRVTTALRASEPPWSFAFARGEGRNIRRDEKQESTIVEKEVPSLDYLGLKRSGWLKHVSALLEGTTIITRNIHVNHSHVLIHCSDGWDRTSQLAALAEICLDPFFRTKRGFAILVEKDWCSFGHRFWDRCGHASSDKYFHTAQGYGEENSEEESGEETGGGFEAQAAANAIWGFTKQFTANFQSSGDGHSAKGHGGAHLKETSPVFHQFLDCIWQIMRQFPTRFEYNEQWLLDIFDGIYECKYGTFLFNSESERNGLSDVGMKEPASARSISIWDFLLDDSQKGRYCNAMYNEALDTDTKRPDADMGVLLPNSKDVGFWGELFRRDGKEMNKLVQAEAEERKRQVEGLEKQRLLELNYSASQQNVTSEGPEEVDGVSVGPVVRNGQDDPVMGNVVVGVVDVIKGDQQKIAYRPYQSRQRTHQPSNAPDGYDANLPSMNVTGTSRNSSGDEGGLGAQDAGAKMKNMFLGWGARFQEAYTNATAGVEEQSDTKFASRPDPSRSNGALLGQGLPSQLAGRVSPFLVEGIAPSPLQAASSIHMRDGDFNPWAVTSKSKGHNKADELPDTLVAAGAAAAPSSRSSQIVSRSESKDVDKIAEQKQEANYDPLGVGAL